jgi:hypothetical protein
MSTSIHPELELNLENVRDGAIKIKNLKVDELKEPCTHFYVLIEDLDVKLEKAKEPSEDDAKDNVTSSKEDDVKGAAKVCATSSEEDNVKGADKVNATTSGEEMSCSGAKLAKLAKLVEMAKSSDLRCLMPFVPSTKEAKAKQRKVCPVNLRGGLYGQHLRQQTPKSLHCVRPRQGEDPEGLVRAVAHVGHVRRQKPGKLHREEERPNPTPGSKGSNSSKAKVRLAKPDIILVKLEATAKTEELKARIRVAKMMSQGVTYSQVVGDPFSPTNYPPTSHQATSSSRTVRLLHRKEQSQCSRRLSGSLGSLN